MKCLFDNNLPPKLAKALNFLEGDDGIEVLHLTQRFPADIADESFIKALKEEKQWFLITRDNNIRRRELEMLAWKESHLKIAFLKKTWMNHTFWDITWRLIKYWPQIKSRIASVSEGNGIIITINGKIDLLF